MPKRDTVFAIMENDYGEILLEQRPARGIWGGLWCFPEFSSDLCIEKKIKKKYGFNVEHHKRYKNKDYDTGVMAWVNPKEHPSLGLPAPVLSMLADLNNSKRVVLNEP